MDKNILPGFQEYLIAKNLASQEKAPFYAIWVSRFLSYERKYEDIDRVLLIDKFLDTLSSSKNTEGWQVHQVEEALRLYFDHFLNRKSNDNTPLLFNKGLPEIIKKTRETIWIKHYSYDVQ